MWKSGKCWRSLSSRKSISLSIVPLIWQQYLSKGREEKLAIGLGFLAAYCLGKTWELGIITFLLATLCVDGWAYVCALPYVVSDIYGYVTSPISKKSMDAVIAKVNSSWSHVLDWTYAGVDYSLPGNGGEDCARFLSPTQRLLESMLATLLGLLTMRLAYPKLTLPATKVRVLTEKETTWKRILLVLMCLTWGCELGFKFATRQMIWIFNPCHIATAVQVSVQHKRTPSLHGHRFF